MEVHSISSVPPLRLVYPAESVHSQKPGSLKSASAPADRQQDVTLSFEAMYRSQLPREPYTEAHRQLELIRERFVAGHTDVPIHFDADRQPRGAVGANPYQGGYLRFPADPAEINARATDASA